MDPVTGAIAAALAALATAATGALTDVTKDAIVKSYEGLKSLLIKKFGGGSEVVEAVEKLEKDPKSEGRKITLKEEVKKAGADQDSEIVNQAKELSKHLQEPVKGSSFSQQAIGSYIIQTGHSGHGEINVNVPPKQP